MGVKPETARSTLRLTTGRPTTTGEIDAAVAAIVDAARALTASPGA
jgi:cysteine sulfinate desulfinase/cysteine desulfurase-like protein